MNDFERMCEDEVKMLVALTPAAPGTLAVWEEREEGKAYDSPAKRTWRVPVVAWAAYAEHGQDDGRYVNNTVRPIMPAPEVGGHAEQPDEYEFHAPPRHTWLLVGFIIGGEPTFEP